MRLIWIPLILSMACTGQDDPVPVPAAGAGAEVINKGEMTAPSADEMANAADTESFQHLQTPSPKEMRRTLSKVGLDMAGPEKTRKFGVGTHKNDHLAVQTGVLLADLVLTREKSTKAQRIAYLQALKANCQKLDVGTDIPSEIDDIIALVNSVEEQKEIDIEIEQRFDELHGVMVPELVHEGAEWLVPLVQAGSWVEGAHLVSKAFKDNPEKIYDPLKGTKVPATSILQQPQVVKYFQRYVAQAKKAGDLSSSVGETLEASLKALAEVAGKDSLTPADIHTIYTKTGDVLNLLD
jgi:hypothetical protein